MTTFQFETRLVACFFVPFFGRLCRRRPGHFFFENNCPNEALSMNLLALPILLLFTVSTAGQTPPTHPAERAIRFPDVGNLATLTCDLHTHSAFSDGDSPVASVSLRNHSDASFMLENLSGFTLHEHPDIVLLPPNDSLELQVKTVDMLPAFDLRFKVWNAVIAPAQHPVIVVPVGIEK